MVQCAIGEPIESFKTGLNDRKNGSQGFSHNVAVLSSVHVQRKASKTR